MNFRRRDRWRQARGERPAGGAAREGGFTLLEVIVALSMMLIAGLGVASAFLYSMSNNTGAGERALAMAVAQQRVERLRTLKFAELDAEAGAEDVVSDGRTYTVVTTIAALDTDADDGITTLKDITVQVTPTNEHERWATDPVILRTQRATLTLGDNR